MLCKGEGRAGRKHAWEHSIERSLVWHISNTTANRYAHLFANFLKRDMNRLKHFPKDMNNFSPLDHSHSLRGILTGWVLTALELLLSFAGFLCSAHAVKHMRRMRIRSWAPGASRNSAQAVMARMAEAATKLHLLRHPKASGLTPIRTSFGLSTTEQRMECRRLHRSVTRTLWPLCTSSACSRDNPHQQTKPRKWELWATSTLAVFYFLERRSARGATWCRGGEGSSRPI